MKQRIREPSDLLTTNAYDITYQEYNDLSFDPRLINEYRQKYGMNANVAPECIACQIGHIEKYKGMTDDHGSVIVNPLSHLTCKFIPKTYALPEKVASQLTAEEKRLLEIVRDPVAWAKYYLGWEAREYQKTTLRCTAKHTVHRWGRRSGKTEQCAVEILWFTFTQEVRQGTDFSGKAITTGPKTMIVTPYLSQIQMVFEKISALLARNKDLGDCMTRFVRTPNYRMEFSNGGVITGFTTGSKSKGEGASLRGQGAHKLYLDECFVNGTPVHTSRYATKPIELLTLSDSILGGHAQGVIEGDILALAKKTADVYSVSTPLTKSQVTANHPLFNGVKDIPALHAEEVIVDASYRSLNFKQEAIKARLAGYIYGDGWLAANGSREIGFSGQKEDLEQIKQDIAILGGRSYAINTRVTHSKKYDIKGVTSQTGTKHMYDEFAAICPTGKKVYQELRVPKYIRESGHKYIKANFLSGLFSADATGITYQTNNLTPRPVELRMYSSRREWADAWARDIKSLLDDLHIANRIIPTIKKDLQQGVRYISNVRVLNRKSNIDRFIKEIGFCYSVAKAIQANKWKLYRWYKKHNDSSLYTPDEVYDLYHSSVEGCLLLPIIKTSRRKIGTKTVYNLTSNAEHRFFGAGMFTHNCDYMEDADYKAILPILHEAADRSIIASSTPTGKRERFFGWCKKKPHWKEFYFPATVLPDWARIEGDVLAETSQAEFQQEYMADFIALDIGVYQPSYVSTAVTNPPYQYSDMTVNPTWIYSIGVDWGDKAGTEIVVTGMDPKGHIWLVDAVNVTKQGWTQMASMQAVITMNRKWRPKYVYVDDGYGGTQVEILRATALKALSTKDPTKDLIRTLKAYNFSAKIPVRDPASGMVIKKPAKDFMVQNSVRRFEEGVIHIPKDDNVIYKQLINYIVERINQSGVRIYGQSNPAVGDHRLDALNLALIAYKLEMSAFSLEGGMSSIVRHAGMLGEHYAERQIQDNAPFAADIRYPEGYMKYNINTGNEKQSRHKSRDFSMPDKNKIVPGKPVYPGSAMKEIKTGFMSDTEHQHTGKQRMNKIVRKSTANVLPSRTALRGPWKR